MTTPELKTCPFCGGGPWFEGDADEWKDDCRYVSLSLRCCATITKSLGWKLAREMSIADRNTELRFQLTQAWNERYVPDAEDLPTGDTK